MGLHKLRDPGLTFRVRAAVLHPKYKPAPSLDNDIALLQVLGLVGGVTVAPGRLSTAITPSLTHLSPLSPVAGL